MSVVWPGALRWTTSIASQPMRCSTGPKFDNLVSRIIQTTQRSYSSPSRSIQQSLINRISRPICYSTPQRTWAFPVRTIANQNNSIITAYQELPEDYTDDAGLDFRSRPLSQKEVTQWFGPGVNADMANTILRILHGRRVAGTVDDPAYANYNGMDTKMKQDGLAWLRKMVPVNEIQNAGLRADDELADMGEGAVGDIQEDIYKPNYDPTETLSLPGSALIYKPNSDPMQSLARSESALDKLKELRKEEAEMLKKEAELMEIEQQALQNNERMEKASGNVVVHEIKSNVELRRPGEHPWLKYYKKRAEEATPDVPPEMTKIQRLLPSGLVVLATVFCSILFAATYSPPVHRLWADMPPAAATIGGIVLINSFFLLAWRVPPMWRFMQKYMMVVPGYPRAAGIFGNMWSHSEVNHFLPNMILLWIIGSRLGDQIGRGDFLAIYLSSGVIASFVSLSSYVMRGIFYTSHLGASGAVCGITAAWAWINMDKNPNVSFFPEGWLPALPEYSTLAILGLVILLELNSLRKVRRQRKSGKEQTIDVINHLGGYATGIVGGEIMRRKMMKKQNEDRGTLVLKNDDASRHTL